MLDVFPMLTEWNFDNAWWWRQWRLKMKIEASPSVYSMNVSQWFLMSEYCIRKRGVIFLLAIVARFLLQNYTKLYSWQRKCKKIVWHCETKISFNDMRKPYENESKPSNAFIIIIVVINWNYFSDLLLCFHYMACRLHVLHVHHGHNLTEFEKQSPAWQLLSSALHAWEGCGSVIWVTHESMTILATS